MNVLPSTFTAKPAAPSSPPLLPAKLLPRAPLLPRAEKEPNLQQLQHVPVAYVAEKRRTQLFYRQVDKTLTFFLGARGAAFLFGTGSRS
jgi:hypothetical protein